MYEVIFDNKCHDFFITDEQDTLLRYYLEGTSKIEYRRTVVGLHL